MSKTLQIRDLTPSDSAAVAALHAACFEAGWPEADFEDSAQRASDFLIGVLDGRRLIAFIQCRASGDQAEVLTFCVAEAARGQGLGRRLLANAEAALGQAGIGTLFLDVAEDNLAAIRLYKASGFTALSRRKAYYRRKTARGQTRIDAIIFRKSLSLPEAGDRLET